jgi:NarL family two-component system sensor histidine kinase LiaS
MTLQTVEITPQVRATTAALANQSDPALLLRTTPDRRVVIAAPIPAADGHVLGALLLVVDLPALQSRVIPADLAGLLFSSIPFTIIAVLVGTLAGLLTARGLRRRLDRLMTAADAWSRGDFGVTARDPSGDELGQLAQHLNSMADQVQALLATRQELAAVEERNRLARDLHDSVKQQIFAAAMQLAATREILAANPAAAEKHLADAQLLVGQAQRELTGLIGELRPAALGDRGLVAALKELGAEWSRRTNIAFDLGTQNEQATSLEIEQALFRVVQEALANIARHSGATKASIHLAWEGGQVQMQIQDNGHGFDVAANDRKGVGLHSMVERVEALGGLVAVASTSSGTRIDAQVPLPQKVEEPR